MTAAVVVVVVLNSNVETCLQRLFYHITLGMTNHLLRVHHSECDLANRQFDQFHHITLGLDKHPKRFRHSECDAAKLSCIMRN